MLTTHQISVRTLRLLLLLPVIGLPCVAGEAPQLAAHASVPADSSLFIKGERCIACHSGMSTSSGRDVSIGYAWRASMMANSARDPYWQASVRREVLDHPGIQTAIEDICSTCHMPMGRALAAHAGGTGSVFAHLDDVSKGQAVAQLALDGVSCALCHQIGAANLGQPESYDGGFVIDLQPGSAPRPLYGPYDVDPGRQRVMRSSSGFQPAAATHLQKSELCATCHTLFTRAVDDQGRAAGQLPEQAPYLEWRHSTYVATHSCQSCHMPEVNEATAITSVLGQPRTAVSEHTFLGGNAFMIRMLSKYRGELAVPALPQELELAARRTEEFLRTRTAAVRIESAVQSGADLRVAVAVRNLSGHKLPTAYPSRRAWLHLTVSDAHGTTLFESGAPETDGSIAGNDNDADASTFEPHYTHIERNDQVQIYESIMVDHAGRVTTGLLYGARYVKDNRLLPLGFDKTTASQDIAVQGDAAQDNDFDAEGDRLRYVVDVSKGAGPFAVSAELLFQSISYRWAQNLQNYPAIEPQRFVAYYNDSAAQSALLLASASATSAPPR